MTIDTSGTANQQSGGNDFNVNNMVTGLFGVADVVATGYFAEQTAKSALKAPPVNTAILIGGGVLVVFMVLMFMRK